MVRKIFVVFLIAATVVYAIALYSAQVQHERWCNEELQSYPVEVRPYVEPLSFWETETGKKFFFGGLCLIWVYAIAIILSGVKDKSLKVFTSAFLVILLATSIVHVLASSQPDVTYDVLVVQDEEFASGTILVPAPPIYFPVPVDANTVAEWAMEDVNETYYTEYGIQLRFHYWYSFHSDDNLYSCYDILMDAISEIGWYWGKEVDGDTMELMVVFTQQKMDGRGLSLPWKRALIVAGVNIDLEKYLLHELGHQFGLEHCSRSCAMNPDPLMTTSYYCLSCSDKIKENKYVLIPPPPLAPRPKSGGKRGLMLYMCY